MNRNSVSELQDNDQQRKRNRFLLKIEQCWTSRLFQCFLVGFLISSIALAIVLVLWMTSSHKMSTTVPPVSSTSTLLSTTVPPVSSTSTSTLLSTTTTSSTTATLPTCGSSCLNQTWLSTTPLLAKWRFENDYSDDTNTYNGTPTGNPVFVQGYIGQAISFTVNSSQMVSTSYIPLANTSFSVDVWIYPTGIANALHNSICGLCPAASADNCFHISLRKTGLVYPLYFGFYADDVNSNTLAPVVNNWVHAAVTFQATTRTASIYRNGILLVTGTTTSVLKAKNGSFQIGNVPLLVASVDTFQGYIDQLYVSDGVMSSCEILEKATLAAYFSFDGSSPLLDLGPNMVSSSGSNYNSVSGRTLQAISFIGSSSSYFQASGFVALGTPNQSFSFSFWVQPQSLAGTLVHVSTDSLGNGTCAPFMGFSSNGSLIAQVMTNTNFVPVSYTNLPLVGFSHIVQTWSATNGIRLYINSVLVSSAAATTYPATSTWVNYVTLGGCLSGCVSCSAASGNQITPGPFTGAVDSFRMYSREITANDVCNLFIYG